MIEVLESVADNLAVNNAVGDDEVVTVLSFVGNTSALLVERVSSISNNDIPCYPFLSCWYN